MNSVRRAAREIALLVLFWADLQEGDDAQTVLASFRENLLEDREILAEVYLELIGGRQPDLALAQSTVASGGPKIDSAWRPSPRQTPLPSRVTKEEQDAHAAFLEKLGADAMWRQS